VDEIVLSGGISSKSGYLNDTWFFTEGEWYNFSELTSGSIPGPAPIWEAAMPTNSSDIAPVEEGGKLSSGALSNLSWVLDIPPAPVVSVLLPNPADVGAVVHVSATHTAGDGSGPVLSAYLDENSTNLYASAEKD